MIIVTVNLLGSDLSYDFGQLFTKKGPPHLQNSRQILKVHDTLEN